MDKQTKGNEKILKILAIMKEASNRISMEDIAKELDVNYNTFKKQIRKEINL